MIFRTEHPIPKYPFTIGYEDHLFFIGSCFSDHIGNFFQNHRFDTLSNPFGTLFHPLSISQNLKLSLTLEKFPEEYLHFHNHRYISFLHQGKHNHLEKEGLITLINNIYQNAHQFLQKTDYVFITLGTAYAYRFIEKQLVVANCHKIPNFEFEKIRFSVDEIVVAYKELLDLLYQVNPTLKVVFTVSPVRHLSDGFHENQLSKSILHLAIDQLVDNQNVFYFPSYELLLDDLRDYRYYAQDLCHPGENGIAYIEEILMESLFTTDTISQCKLVQKEVKRENHRPLK